MSDAFYLQRRDTVLGPCTVRDVEQFLTYGSIKPDDLVRSDVEDEWHPLESDPRFFEIIQDLRDRRQRKDGSPVRRRIVRYRNYDKVPEEQRGHVMFWRLFTGWFLPWRLWKAAAVLFSQRIYRRALDEEGFLKAWPAWIEIVVSVLLVLNLIFWAIVILVAFQSILPLWHTLVEIAKPLWDHS
ncbi:MAG: hypothetical protein KDK99_18065 [Verrucomicrobiales bacterium]|nr:hypothetical protein [Verrucomicrobiales bacterium]